MSLLDTIDRIDAHQVLPFIAPVPDSKIVDLFTLQTFPYWFRVNNPRPGWWMVTPLSETRAHLERLARPAEFMPYLEQLVRFHVVALFPLSGSTWLCVPLNAGSAAQRGWLNSEPRALHLVRHNLEALDIVSAKMMAGTLLYDDVRHARAVGKARSIAEGIIRSHQEKLVAVDRAKALAEQRLTVDGQMQQQLELSGAKLLDWSDLGNGYEVTWEHDGHSYDMRVNRNLTIRSAGICLNDQDSCHDLATIVHTMEEARRLQRFDL